MYSKGGIDMMMNMLKFLSWTPLIRDSDFGGIQTDVTTIVKGIIFVALIILGAGLIIRAMGR